MTLAERKKKKGIQKWSSWFYVCEPVVRMLISGVLQEPWATARHWEVIVQRVAQRPLFIRGGQGCRRIVWAATAGPDAPRTYTTAASGKVGDLTDNRQVSRGPADHINHLAPTAGSSSPPAPPALLSFSPSSADLFISLQLLLICGSKLAPSTPLSPRLGRAKGLLSKRTAGRER